MYLKLSIEEAGVACGPTLEDAPSGIPLPGIVSFYVVCGSALEDAALGIPLLGIASSFPVATGVVLGMVS